MKIEAQTRDDHQMRLVVEFEQDVFEKFKHQAARKISQNSRVPGFRPGKAPYDTVRRIYGEKAIAEQAIELLIDEKYADVLKEANITPSGPGSLSEIVSAEPLTLAFLVPLEPTITLGDYKSIRIAYEPKAITDEDVEEYVTRIRKNYSTVDAVERPAAEGDLIYVSVSGKITDPDEGQDPEVSKDTPYSIIIEAEGTAARPNAWPFPGFDRLLLGKSANDEFEVEHLYPEDTNQEILRNKHVLYQVKVQTVKAVVMPEVTDEFARSLSDFASADDLRSSIRKQLEEDAIGEYEQGFFTTVLDQIRETTTLKYPPHMLEEETTRALADFKHNLEHQKMDLESYLKYSKLDEAAFMEQTIRPSALRRLERALIMEEVARAEKLSLDMARLDQLVSASMYEIQQSDKKQKITNELAQSVTMEAANRLMNRQILEKLKSIVTGQADAEALSAVETAVEPAVEGAEAASEPAPEAAEPPAETGSETA